MEEMKRKNIQILSVFYNVHLEYKFRSKFGDLFLESGTSHVYEKRFKDSNI